MTRVPDDDLDRMMRASLPPPPDTTPPDLWPRMRDRLAARDDRRVPVEWLVAAAVIVLSLFRADLLDVFFFHF